MSSIKPIKFSYHYKIKIANRERKCQMLLKEPVCSENITIPQIYNVFKVVKIHNKEHAATHNDNKQMAKSIKKHKEKPLQIYGLSKATIFQFSGKQS